MPTAYEKKLIALERVLQTLREEENANVLIETTLDYLKAEFEYSLIWIGLYDRLDHKLFGKGGITPTGDTTLLHQRFFLNPGDLLEQVVIQQRPVGIPDLREEVRAGEWRRAAQQFGIQGTLLFPVRCKDRCFGVALLGSPTWGVSSSAAARAQLSLLLGGLASALYQIEVDWQRASTKRPDQALFQMLDSLTAQTTMQQRLEAVIANTQQFIAPTRTSLYWFEPQGRYFWHLVGNQQKARAIADSRTAAPGITVQEVNDFYAALVAGQTVAIGAGRSPLKAEVTGRLMKRLRARSMLAAPIIVRQELVGFLAVEGKEARIWEEAEKNYVRAAAELVAMVAESEESTGALQQSLSNTQLVGRVASEVANHTDPTAALEQCAKALLKRLGVERFLLLKKDTSGEYTQVYQDQTSPNRRAISTPLPALGSEFQTEDRGRQPVAIEDWEEDERLFEWKSLLVQVGVRSLLACPTGSAATAGLLLLCHGTPRTWNHIEQDLILVVSQQIGLLTQIRELQTLNSFTTDATEKERAALNALLSFPEDPEAMTSAFVTFLARELSCPLAALLSWTPDNPLAYVTGAVVASPSFALPPNLAINIDQDALIQEALRADSLLERRIEELPDETRIWLNSTDIGSLLVMALPDFGSSVETRKQASLHLNQRESRLAPKSILLLADHAQRNWPGHLLPVVETLVRQFAMLRHYLHSFDAQERDVRDLEQLNWYKHRCLEAFHQVVSTNVSALVELGIKQDKAPSDPLRRMRQGQLLHQMQNTLATLSPVLNEEQWHSTLTLTQIPLANLLKRSLLLLTPLIKQRQLSVKINIPSSERIYGDRLKLECVFFELLLLASNSTQIRGRIDLWCRQVQKELNVERLQVEGSGELQVEGSGELKVEGLKVEGSNLSSNLQPLNLQPSTKEQPSTPLASGQQTTDNSLLELLITDKVAFERMNSARERSAHSQPGRTIGGKMNEYLILSSIEPPNLNLKICQRVLRSWGGDLHFYQLENGHLLIKLLSPDS